MDLKEQLKDYPNKKAIVQSTQARIELWRETLKENAMQCFFYSSPSNYGMPKAPYRTGSPTEHEICSKEVTREQVEQWIRDDESRIFWYKLEVEQIDIALQSLKKNEQYIIDKKYFEDWFWRTIEASYNETFKHAEDYKSERTLKRMHDEALNKLNNILGPFYQQHKIA